MNDTQWMPLLVGLGIAMVVGGTGSLLFGHRQLRRRRQRDQHALPLPQKLAAAPAYDPFDCGSAADKRQALRRRGQAVTVLVANEEMSGEPTRATVLDRSVGGLRFLTDQPVEVGSRLNVRVAHAPQMIPWIRVEVMNRADTEHGCEIGCRFLQTPPSSVLWLFG